MHFIADKKILVIPVMNVMVTPLRFLCSSARLCTYKHLHPRDKSHLSNLAEEVCGEALYPTLL